ncbi:efflux RND transporter periplasmic adaptor subunit [Vicingus serpentipes]|uniref:Efflux RND transporter periplasmic adaptor subunit n=1 Tax=Vicingus serpentipes TaxID=1926625 RepID=A0A5C6RS04_9FLAO|nr:efflux RND transporter periplasmic adaptor subunit [Vicingus serpentipes]TXB64734.1 efflux RND transporter periplasmic adaptor subunit [Vicingus serpentipes]
MKNIILYSIVLASFTACNETKKAENITEEETTTLIEETVKTEKNSPINQNIECFGVVDVPPFAVHEIFAKTSGYILDLTILEGQHVKKGEVIAEIESPDFANLQKEYKSAKATFDWHEQNFKRNEKLYESNAIADKDFQLIEKEYKIAKANYIGLKEEIKSIGFDENAILNTNDVRLKIRSKTSGTIVKINVKNGSMVSPQMHLFTLLDKAHLHVEMSVAAANITNVKAEQPFFIMNGNDSIAGTVHLINEMIEEDNTVKVHGHFNNVEDEEKLIVGQKVFVNIVQ